jgi:hypothetical protein
LHGDEDERRAVGTGSLLGLPFEEAEAQKKHVGTAFLEGEACGAEEVCAAGVGILLWRLGAKFLAIQSFQEIGAAAVFVLAFSEKGWVASVTSVEDCGAPKDPHAATVRQLIEETGRIGTFDRQRLAVLKV